MFIGDSSRVFKKKKKPNGNAENEVSMTCCTPQHCTMKLAPAQFHCNFPLFHCLESFCRLFPNVFQALISVEFNYLLNSWSSNTFVICEPSFILVSLILGNFCLK
jgi:hypothetical protein